MSNFKRVQLPSGAKVTVTRIRDHMTVLEDEPALDRNGRPLAPTYPVKDGEPVPAPYTTWTKAELENEIERRNDARDGDAAEIIPQPPGNKPQLVAALEADDARANQ